ncbi:type VII secretion target [Streptomyces pharetrae]|uniref:type VII secretion target n=1 Tax=Streptomyces pharetrae TaxID=291370 RepID=UPI00365C7534
MAPTDGYQVKSGLTGQAKELDGAGGDAGKITKVVSPTVCHPQDTLGGADSGPAFDAFAAAWEAEAETLEAALHELAAKVRAAKGAYSGSDGLVATQASGVRVADGSLPAPGVATMPARAGRSSVLTRY